MAARSVGHDELVIGAVQCPLRSDHEHPLKACNVAIQLMKQACSNKTDLFVLPELAPIGYSEDSFQRFLPNTPENIQLYKEIHARMMQVAAELNSYICYGTIGTYESGDNAAATSEQQGNHDENKFTIRQVVVSPAGTTVACYDKMFLCDYGDCAETRFFVPGNQLVSFALGKDFKVGILVCADMRNPMLARKLAAKHNVDIILQPVAFARDFSFRTWKSFCETRAVENSVYWVGVNYSGDYYGESSFTEPWVDDKHEPQVMASNSGVLVGTVRRRTLNHVRETMPYYKQLCSEAL